MSGPLARLSSYGDDSRQDYHGRRKEARFHALLDGCLETMKGDCLNVSISEVSLHGCRIKSEQNCLRNGQFVSVGLAGHPRMQAIVRWVRDEFSGLEFLHAIPQDRVEWHQIMDLPA